MATAAQEASVGVAAIARRENVVFLLIQKTTTQIELRLIQPHSIVVFF